MFPPSIIREKHRKCNGHGTGSTVLGGGLGLFIYGLSSLS